MNPQLIMDGLIAGAMIGKVTSFSTCQGFEPRSIAASSMEMSMEDSRD